MEEGDCVAVLAGSSGVVCTAHTHQIATSSIGSARYRGTTSAVFSGQTNSSDSTGSVDEGRAITGYPLHPRALGLSPGKHVPVVVTSCKKVYKSHTQCKKSEIIQSPPAFQLRTLQFFRLKLF